MYFISFPPDRVTRYGIEAIKTPKTEVSRVKCRYLQNATEKMLGFAMARFEDHLIHFGLVGCEYSPAVSHYRHDQQSLLTSRRFSRHVYSTYKGNFVQR